MNKIRFRIEIVESSRMELVCYSLLEQTRPVAMARPTLCVCNYEASNN